MTKQWSFFTECVHKRNRLLLISGFQSWGYDDTFRKGRKQKRISSSNCSNCKLRKNNDVFLWDRSSATTLLFTSCPLLRVSVGETRVTNIVLVGVCCSQVFSGNSGKQNSTERVNRHLLPRNVVCLLQIFQKWSFKTNISLISLYVNLFICKMFLQDRSSDTSLPFTSCPPSSALWHHMNFRSPDTDLDFWVRLHYLSQGQIKTFYKDDRHQALWGCWLNVPNTQSLYSSPRHGCYFTTSTMGWLLFLPIFFFLRLYRVQQVYI